MKIIDLVEYNNKKNKSAPKTLIGSFILTSYDERAIVLDVDDNDNLIIFWMDSHYLDKIPMSDIDKIGPNVNETVF